MADQRQTEGDLHTARYEWSPLRVFVIWHPCFVGDAVVESLYEWFGGPIRELHRSGNGIPVHPWSSNDPDFPPELPWLSDDELTVIIPLLDGEFLGRSAWREWLEKLAESIVGKNAIMLPWAIHSAATQLRAVQKSQLLGSHDIDKEQFRRAVTEACSLALLGVDFLEVFISYARRDGGDVVTQILSTLRQYGHVNTFCDVHDIPPGADWESRIRCALDRGAAMISVLTDTFAGRPWCREELRVFREPRRSTSTTNQWWLPPALVLDHRTGEATRSVMEIGSSTTAKWSKENSALIVDQLIREILFSSQARRRAERFGSRLADADCSVNWIPDSWTILSLLRKGDKVQRIVYPGDGLPDLELSRLRHLFPTVDFISFEQFYDTESSLSGSNPKLRPVAIFSVSDTDAKELKLRGYTPLHLNDFVSRLGRLALRNGFDIGYGGKPNAGFTEGLQTETGSIALEPRLINFLGWPYFKKLSSSQIADDLGVCRYIHISSTSLGPATDVRDEFAILSAISQTRERMFNDEHVDIASKPIGAVSVSICCGGKVDSYVGVLPGIIEEAIIAIKRGCPVYLIGAFGGAASCLIEMILNPEATKLSWLESTNSDINNRRAIAQDELLRIVGEVRRTRSLGNGLSWEQNCDLMTATDLGLVIELIERGFKAIRNVEPTTNDIESD